MVKASARREVVRALVGYRLSERHALRIVGMSASAYRYQPVPDSNQALREHILALAHRHRRYGAGMIYLKLRQAGLKVNSTIQLNNHQFTREFVNKLCHLVVLTLW